MARALQCSATAQRPELPDAHGVCGAVQWQTPVGLCPPSVCHCKTTDKPKTTSKKNCGTAAMRCPASGVRPRSPARPSRASSHGRCASGRARWAASAIWPRFAAIGRMAFRHLLRCPKVGLPQCLGVRRRSSGDRWTPPSQFYATQLRCRPRTCCLPWRFLSRRPNRQRRPLCHPCWEQADWWGRKRWRR